ncbi:hypothetical protein LCGC14_1973030, partial [marine sediment metagenome]
MKSNDYAERILRGTAVPSVVEGDHRQRLKRQLLDPPGVQRTKTRMSAWKYVMSTGRTKVAAACVATVILVATGWTAERVYRKFAKSFFVTETIAEGEFTAPGGKKLMWAAVEGELN